MASGRALVLVSILASALAAACTATELEPQGVSADAVVAGVELFDRAGCEGNARWMVASREQCAASSRPDFYARSVRAHGTCEDITGSVEEDVACRDAFAVVKLFDHDGCTGSPRWSVAAPSECSDSSRPDFYARSVKADGRCRSISGSVEEDVACRGSFGAALFDHDGCVGAPTWSVASYEECSSPSRPDFYARSVMLKGVCRSIEGSVEEDVACRGTFGVSLYDRDGCAGSPRWTVASYAECSDSSRPDFYARSVKVDGACRAISGSVEEDMACRATLGAASLYDRDGCEGAPRWVVGGPEECSSPSRPDFYARSVSVKGVCQSISGSVEEDAACRSATAAVNLFDRGDCDGQPRWSVSSLEECSATTRPDFYARSVKVDGVCRAISGSVEEDAACRQSFGGTR